MTTQQKFAQVCILGAPNAGKSTLLNAILGEHLAPVHRKAQMTRRNLLGLWTENGTQLAFVDTPGLHHSDKELNARMMIELERALEPADIVVVLLPVDQKLSPLVVEKVKSLRLETTLIVMTKCDLKPETWTIDPNSIEELIGKKPILISAEQKVAVEELMRQLVELAPVQPFLYAEDDLTVATTRDIVAEYIRESVMEYLHDEIPYEVMVVIDSFKEESNKVRVMASLLVNQESQKPVVIGRAGTNLKRIRTRSEKLIHKLVSKSVSLQLHVKVDTNWIKQSQKIEQNF